MIALSHSLEHGQSGQSCSLSISFSFLHSGAYAVAQTKGRHHHRNHSSSSPRRCREGQALALLLAHAGIKAARDTPLVPEVHRRLRRPHSGRASEIQRALMMSRGGGGGERVS